MAFELLTWNSQGAKWGEVWNAVKQRRPAVFCLQECGVPPDYGFKKFATGTFGTYWSATYNGYYIFYCEWLYAVNRRCDLAILSQTKTSSFYSESNYRPMIGLEIEPGKFAFTLHAPASNQAAEYNKTLLIQGIRRLAKQPSAWICAGDFNCEPKAMASPAHWRVIASANPTQQSGGVLDYAVYAGQLQVGYQGAVGTLVSDHYGQAFSVSW